MASNPTFGETTKGTTVTAAFSSEVRNRIFLITGVSPGGIGASTAVALASEAPKLLILTGRTEAKTAAVIAEIQKAHPGVSTRFLQLDLANNASVRTAAREIMDDSSIEQIDVLINNAGVLMSSHDVSADGIEMQFASNHIGHFLFTNLIMPKIIKAAQTSPRDAVRIVNVASAGHMYGPVRFSDPNFTVPQEALPEAERGNLKMIERFGRDSSGIYNAAVAYGQSKTANVLFSVGLNARLYEKYGISSFALHPGGISTELWRHDATRGASTAEIAKKAGGYWKNLEEGCSTTLVAAVDKGLSLPDGKSGGGVYLEDCQVKPPRASWACEPDGAHKLWTLSEQLVSESFAL